MGKELRFNGDNRMNQAIRIIGILLFIIIALCNFSFATEGDISLRDKEIIEKLARLKESQRALKSGTFLNI